MEDNQTQQQEAVLTEQEREAQILTAAFGDATPQQDVVENENNEGSQTQQQEQTQPNSQEEPKQTFDAKEYIKTKFGVEAEEELLQLVEKAKKPIEPVKPTFANEESESLYNLILEGKVKEATKILNEQERLNNLLEANIDSVAIADEIIKANLKQEYKGLSDADIERKFKKMYSIPKEPVKTELESEEDFEARLDEWKEQKNEIEQDKILDAKIVKPKLESLKKDIQLPKFEQKAQEIDTVDEAALEAQRNEYLQILNSDFQKYEGIKVTAKDGEVELPVTFVLDTNEKASIKALAENFDAEDYLGKRWLTKDGKPNVAKIMDDITLLELGEKAFQKVANEAVAKAKEKWAAEKKNIDLEQGSSSNANLGTQQVFDDPQEGLAAAVFGSKPK